MQTSNKVFFALENFIPSMKSNSCLNKKLHEVQAVIIESLASPLEKTRPTRNYVLEVHEFRILFDFESLLNSWEWLRRPKVITGIFRA